MNWIFKTGDFLHFEKDGKTAVASIAQKLNFSGEKGEQVLILDWKADEWQFTRHYEITSVVIKELQSGYKQITITMHLVEMIQEEKLLEDYIYSLRRITNYGDPMRHFLRKYTRLFDPEFDAIMYDKIYQKRTVFGTVLNAMHSKHKEAFIRYLASENPVLLTNKTNLDTALDLLIKYLDFAVVKPALYLDESAKILRSIVSDSDMGEVGFGSDLEKSIIIKRQLIQPQVKAIQEHLRDLANLSKSRSRQQLESMEDSSSFKRLFRNTSLPITLN